MGICYDGHVARIENDLSKTLTIECNSVCLIQRNIDLEIEMSTQMFENIDTIVINGIKYKKEI